MRNRGNGHRYFQRLAGVKPYTVLLAVLCVAAFMLSGCRVTVNDNTQDPSVEEMLADRALAVDPVAYSAEGSYTITVRYDKGGFSEMDLSRAYVAYYPFTVRDQIDTITGGDDEEIPPLPADVQNAMDEATGAGRLVKIAVIAVATVDDQTLNVSFTDADRPVKGQEYFFIIPNEGLAGSVIPG